MHISVSRQLPEEVLVDLKEVDLALHPVAGFVFQVGDTLWGCCGLCFDINQPSLPTPFYSVLVSVSVFMAHSTVFHSINSPGNSLLSHFLLMVLFLPNWLSLIHI